MRQRWALEQSQTKVPAFGVYAPGVCCSVGVTGITSSNRRVRFDTDWPGSDPPDARCARTGPFSGRRIHEGREKRNQPGRATPYEEAVMQILIGVVVVAVLIGAFVLGSKVRDGESGPPSPSSHPLRPSTDRLPGRMSEYRRPAEVPRADGTRRLRPYQLRAGTETSPVPPRE
ncbi:DUF6479 family protein [Streptomyces sp. NPDC020472]|uniref:DUF6479 family protein n=1 Tax=Streptomyces sp. NPDC020472 TaxID=3365075 RepID=UPI0037ABEAF6